MAMESAHARDREQPLIGWCQKTLTAVSTGEIWASHQRADALRRQWRQRVHQIHEWTHCQTEDTLLCKQQQQQHLPTELPLTKLELGLFSEA